MEYNELVVGQKLELELLNNEEEKTGYRFVSEFEGESQEDLLIAAPIYQGRLYPISIDAKVSISFVMKNNLYEFFAKVVERQKKNNLSILKVRPIREIRKLQRREFFRFDVNVVMNYKIEGAQDYVEGETRDLSGGGLCLCVKEPVGVDKFLDCKLLLASTSVMFKGRVVRLTKYDEPKGNYNYELGILFELIDITDREKIISFIFQEQRRLLKKG